MALTRKQQVFIAEYLRDFNATRSAIAAGYSQKTAYSIGQENLNKPEIKQVIDATIAEKSMTANEVLTRLADIARGDVADLMDITTMGFTLNLTTKENGHIIPNPKTKLIKKIKQKVTTHIAKSESDEDREVVETEVELYSALEALSLLGKSHKLFIDRTELTGAEGKPLLVQTVGFDVDKM
jgi:phage terminase small subunit